MVKARAEDYKAVSTYRRAVGLSYNRHKDDSPVISLQGDNLEADQIVKLAKRFGVPIIQKKELARALSSLSLDQNVPADLFEAIALVIAEVDKKIK